MELPTGTVTFLFTDIEGSTRLLEELGERYDVVLAEHHRVIREALERHDGVEVDTAGDAFFVAFARATDAVAAAADAQSALAEGPVRVRMGLHTGEPRLSNENYLGMDVHRGARVMSAGHGGQVLLSQVTRDLLEARFELRDLGEHRLKDLSAPQRLFQLGHADFPPLKTLHQTNLPVQPTPLVGREHELAEIGGLLGGSRLVTLTGAGGSGKTRLALHAAADLVDEFPHGVWWVPLAPVRDPELVESAIAAAVGAKDGLGDHLRSQRALLLLDNFEQLVSAAPVVGALLADAPDIRILATSRERLGIAAEHEYAVPTLVPPEAVELFTARARQLKAGFEPGDAIEQICLRLDGLPLAVELAAARVKVLSPEQILERLGKSLELLTAGSRDAPERHRTLRATIEWSFDLLDEAERGLFARLSVFRGSFDLDAAEPVADADLDTLSGLVDKSLLRQRDDGRFFLLETIREFAAEHFEAGGAADDVRRAHLDHFVALAERADAELKQADQERWLGLLGLEKENLRAAIDWAADRESSLALRLCSALAWSWSSGSDIQEGRRRIEAALERAPDAPPRVRLTALDGASVLSHAVGEFEAECRYATEQLRIADGLKDPAGRARSLSNLAIGLGGAKGDWDRALELLTESVEIAKSSGDDWALMVSALNLGSVALARGDHEVANRSLEEALALSTKHGDRLARMHILFNLGRSRFELGDPAGAAGAFEESLRMCSELGFSDGVAFCLAGLAAVEHVRGKPAKAARLVGAALAGLEALEIEPEAPDQAFLDAVVEGLTQELGAERATEAIAAGRTVDLYEAAAHALREEAPT